MLATPTARTISLARLNKGAIDIVQSAGGCTPSARSTSRSCSRTNRRSQRTGWPGRADTGVIRVRRAAADRHPRHRIAWRSWAAPDRARTDLQPPDGTIPDAWHAITECPLPESTADRPDLPGAFPPPRGMPNLNMGRFAAPKIPCGTQTETPASRCGTSVERPAKGEFGIVFLAVVLAMMRDRVALFGFCQIPTGLYLTRVAGGNQGLLAAVQPACRTRSEYARGTRRQLGIAAYDGRGLAQ